MCIICPAELNVNFPSWRQCKKPPLNPEVLFTVGDFLYYEADMAPKIKEALEKAFRSKDTSHACLAVAKLFSKDKTPRTLDSISKKIRFGGGATLFTLDRLYDAKVLNCEPEFSKKAPQITYKYSVKPEFVKYLKAYATPLTA